MAEQSHIGRNVDTRLDSESTSFGCVCVKCVCAHSESIDVEISASRLQIRCKRENCDLQISIDSMYKSFTGGL